MAPGAQLLLLLCASLLQVGASSNEEDEEEQIQMRAPQRRRPFARPDQYLHRERPSEEVDLTNERMQLEAYNRRKEEHSRIRQQRSAIRNEGGFFMDNLKKGLSRMKNTFGVAGLGPPMKKGWFLKTSLGRDRDKMEMDAMVKGAERISDNVIATYDDATLARALRKFSKGQTVVQYSSPLCSHCVWLLPHFLGTSAANPDTKFIIADVGEMVHAVKGLSRLPYYQIYHHGKCDDAFLGGDKQALSDHMWLWRRRRPDPSEPVDDHSFPFRGHHIPRWTRVASGRERLEKLSPLFEGLSVTADGLVRSGKRDVLFEADDEGDEEDYL